MTVQQPATVPRPEQAWAQIEVEPGRLLQGELVAFDARTAVVALAESPGTPPGRAVWLVLGIDGEQPARVAASVLHYTEKSGRHCVTLELADVASAGKRRHPRVPYTERVELIGITDRPGPDPRWRGTSFDLSLHGLGAVLPSEIRIGALVLLRCPLPPHRSAFQVRATVKSCTREPPHSFRAGFVFDRVTAGHIQQLQAAILHLARERLSTR